MVVQCTVSTHSERLLEGFSVENLRFLLDLNLRQQVHLRMKLQKNFRLESALAF